MKIAIMQPYFIPYIGYFQLINAVDKFVIYDNIQFTKKGWINRNRILVNDAADYITLPLKKDSDYLNVNDRRLADSFAEDKIKIIARISELYRKTPQYKTVFPLIESIINSNEENLFDFIFNSLKLIASFLEIKTQFIISSSVPIDHSLKSEDKVIAICKQLKADQYINVAGGMHLYSKETFNANNLELHFIRSNAIEYSQFESEFVPWLSIIDVLFFNPKEKVRDYLNDYSIL